jgi:dipeptidyl aminopeptidase/acylaminoacyl peptidase
MTLNAGSSIGPYEVVGPLGAGGMGEVYRARDIRLNRQVAIKVLPEALSSDRDRLRRFEKEARSASALNHPNIVTIYEVGSADSTSYIVMELVDGVTLRELLADAPLPARRMLNLAAQVAGGLAKAHGSGIVHRDLKPDNVMVTGDGHVKILDFGLAKLTEPDPSAGQETRSPTVSAGTESGVVMGTAGYMSPEQASGRPLDFRSDQFSFGSMLYEMATGKHAFARETKPETLTAIIRDDPEPIASLNPKLPAPLRWIIERCLAKDPRERYASTEDLARDLAHIRDHLSEASVVSGPTAAAVAAAGRARRRWLLGAAALAAAAVLGLLAGRQAWREPTFAPKFQRLTFRRGLVGNARFASEGHAVVYSASWEGEPTSLYLTQVGSNESRMLFEDADLYDISSSGELAVVAPAADIGTLSRMPMTGGAPRAVVAGIAWGDATWAPGGKELAVIHAVSGMNRLEYPVGTPLYQTTNRIGAPRFSPGGDRIAFYEMDREWGVSVLEVSSRKKTRISRGWDEMRGGMPTWSRDGREVWFTASEPGQPEALWAADLSGENRLVTRGPGMLELFDISSDGRVLVAHHIVIHSLMCLAPGDTAVRDLSWLSESRPTALSADGKTLVITEGLEGGGPAGSVYLRKTDGSAAVRLGDGVGTGISPDGLWVVAIVRSLGGKPLQLNLLPTGPGQTRTLVSEGFETVRRATWTPDGRSIVFTGIQPGRRERLYLLDVASGRRRPLAPEGVRLGPLGGVVSPDGRYVIALENERPVLWPIEGSQAVPIPGLDDSEVPIQFTPDGRALYVIRRGEETVKIWILDRGSGSRRAWKEIRPADPQAEIVGVLMTPDGGAYAYGMRRPISTAYVVEGLR